MADIGRAIANRQMRERPRARSGAALVL